MSVTKITPMSIEGKSCIARIATTYEFRRSRLRKIFRASPSVSSKAQRTRPQEEGREVDISARGLKEARERKEKGGERARARIEKKERER